MLKKLIVLVVAFGLFMINGVAQEQTEPEITPEPLPVQAQTITIDADDGLDLVADFYLVDPARPTVILLHEIYKDRMSWDPLLLPLIANHFNILAPDIRGGWGETRGAINWFNAVDDVSVWINWLTENEDLSSDAVHIIGSSMGSSLAIVGCANEDACLSAVGISPGWNYYRISVANSIAERPVLVIYAERDRWPALGVPMMAEAAPDTLIEIVYDGNAHGMDLFKAEQESMVLAIIEWLHAR